MAAEQFAELTHQRMPVFENAKRRYSVYEDYNRDKDTLDVGTATNAGMAVQHHYPYDHNMTLEANLQAVNEKLNRLEEYRRSYKRRNMAAVCVGNGSVIYEECGAISFEGAPHPYSPYRFSFRYRLYVIITTAVCQSLTVTAAYHNNIDCFRRYNPLRAGQSVS